MGRMVAGDEDSYRYLVESIRKFPNQARFAAMLKAAGFERVTWRNLSGGIVAIHSGWKL
jgi:demethylmenaquinone methyltransferase/2-methoxy-6-polyprenyl-1,4-benzoquinol methylase